MTTNAAGYRPGPYSRPPLAPHQMRERFTATEDLFALCHLGVPLLDADSWSLTIDLSGGRERGLKTAGWRNGHEPDRLRIQPYCP